MLGAAAVLLLPVGAAGSGPLDCPAVDAAVVDRQPLEGAGPAGPAAVALGGPQMLSWTGQPLRAAAAAGENLAATAAVLRHWGSALSEAGGTVEQRVAPAGETVGLQAQAGAALQDVAEPVVGVAGWWGWAGADPLRDHWAVG